jgi:hypothetical protein
LRRHAGAGKNRGSTENVRVTMRDRFLQFSALARHYSTHPSMPGLSPGRGLGRRYRPRVINAARRRAKAAGSGRSSPSMMRA